MNEQTNQNETSKRSSQSQDESANVASCESQPIPDRCTTYKAVQICKVIGLCFAGILLIIGVPLIINELYRRPGYTTMWSAADMLGYYGTLLGAFVGITTLIMTIWFTRRQIQREGYLKTEKEKWDKIESLISQELVVLNPMQLVMKARNCGSNQLDIIKMFQIYQTRCQMATSELLAYLNAEDYKKLKTFLIKVIDDATLFASIVDEGIEAYKNFFHYMIQNQMRQTVAYDKVNPNAVLSDAVEYEKAALNEISDMSWDDIQNQITAFNRKMVAAYEENYKQLLNLKRSSFESIDEEIHNNSNRMLYFGIKY